MAGGKASICATITVGGNRFYDVTNWNSSLSADLLWNRADCRKYGQYAGSVNHDARISLTTLDLSNAKQSSASTPLVGEIVSAVALTIPDNGTSSMIHTLAKAVCVSASASGQNGQSLATLEMEWAAAGEGGTEPTVTWAVGA